MHFHHSSNCFSFFALQSYIERLILLSTWVSILVSLKFFDHKNLVSFLGSLTFMLSLFIVTVVCIYVRYVHNFLHFFVCAMPFFLLQMLLKSSLAMAEFFLQTMTAHALHLKRLKLELVCQTNWLSIFDIWVKMSNRLKFLRILVNSLLAKNKPLWLLCAI